MEYTNYSDERVVATFTRHEQANALLLLDALADKLEVDHRHPFRGFIDAIRRAKPIATVMDRPIDKPMPRPVPNTTNTP